MSSLSRFKSSVANGWSKTLWDGLIDAMEGRLAPLEENLGLDRTTRDAIIARGLTVIELQIAPVVQQAEDKLSTIEQMRVDSIAAYAVIQALADQDLGAVIEPLLIESRSTLDDINQLLSDIEAAVADIQRKSEKDAPAGYAGLDASGKLPFDKLSGVPAAAEGTAGVAKLATGAEVNTGSDAAKVITPAALISRTATTDRTGLVELATGTEAAAGIDTDRAVTAAGLRATLDGQAVRIDAAQMLLASQKGRARANIDAGILSGFRNKIINGNFDVWQRGTTQTSLGYGSDDRWLNDVFESTQSHSQQNFTLGQTDVPGNPKYFSRTVVTSGVTSTCAVVKKQRIEDVRTLSGRVATLTFYAKADASKSIAFSIEQGFGTGGAPSSNVNPAGTKVNLTTSWQKFTQTVSIPSISGKTLGTDENSWLQVSFWFNAGSSFDSRTGALGLQSGTFDIARVSLVEGDATAEADPFSPRHIQQEVALCQRYFCIQDASVRGYSRSGVMTETPVYWPVMMRASPTVSLVSAGTVSNCTAVVAAKVTPTSARFGAQANSDGEFYAINAILTADAEL
ncbi:hypothetical protein Nham_3328 [Nitrobacter hamburgensis X14]|uniref:Uncharacterized protein n=1 Tax=Nitrobacter hamburgensis (strain DSM 10229 / NCIMB 13809 / X14) TaxID=323097 RepID=Q1QI87_NITHX|nr:hypothetical protein [Nitrobacter hamburgensis]ABE64060.1 hypothetical protein Nham_3328 [Nitrobacter hamburgensis X14]